MIYTKCLWTGQCQVQPGAVLFQMPHPSGAGRTRRPQCVFPPGPRWSRSHIRGEVPALHGRFHSRVCPCSGSSADSPGTLVDFHGSPRSPPESSVSAACALLVAVALVTEPEKAIREMLNPCGCTATPPDWQSSRGSQPITRERRTPSGTTAGVSPSAVGSLTCLPGAKYEQGPARARENVAAGKQAGELSRGIPWTPESRTPSRPCVRRCGKGALPECQPGDPSLSQIGKGFLQCLELSIEVKCSRPPVLADFHGFGNNLRIINI